MKVPTYETPETSVLRIDFLEEGASFNTSDSDHNAVLILEDKTGFQYGFEFISIEELESFIMPYLDLDIQFIEYLKYYTDNMIEEDGIEFSITNFDILQMIEDFRVSEFNQSSYIQPHND